MKQTKHIKAPEADARRESDAGGLERLVPECWIYFRFGRAARRLNLRPALLPGAGLVLIAVIGWTAYATGGRTVDERRADPGALGFAAATEDERRLPEDALEIARARADLAGMRLAEKQKSLAQTTRELREAMLELSTLRDAYAKVRAERVGESARIAELEKELADLRLGLTEAANADADAMKAMRVFSGAIERVIEERDLADRKSIELAAKVDALSTEVVHWETRQERVMARLEEAARISMEGLEKVFKRADLDIDDILEKTRRRHTGSGGPLIPVTSDRENIPEAARATALSRDLETVNLMRIAVERIPLGRPLRGGRYTSGFGPRQDPFTRQTAMHAGIDWAGPAGMPIYATGDGVVTFAGRDRGYGIVVRIRHAFGFESVYAHLRRTRVSVGQDVVRGQRIGDMGNTGRSAGTHLHYEIRAGKRPLNPVNFIEAFRDVL